MCTIHCQLDGLQGGQDRVLVLPGLCLDINCERECVHPLGW